MTITPDPARARPRGRRPRRPGADGLSDAALLAAVALGDHAACAVFVARFQRQVYGLAYAVCGDARLAEDVGQATFERVWRHAATFDERRASVRTWVLMIARRLAIDVVRARRTTPLAPDDIAMILAPATVDTARVAVARSEVARVIAALAQLPEAQRRAVALAAFGGRSASEIAAIERVPLGTAKTRLRLGLRRLRGELGDPRDEVGGPDDD